MKKMYNNIYKIVIAATLIMGIISSNGIKINAVSIGKTFAEQFPSARTADVIAAHFGKISTDEIDSSDLLETELVLNNQNITDIRGIEIFINLAHLFLSNNQIRTIPAEIGGLTNLTHLYLLNNRISVIPPEIGNLHNLTHLLLFRNFITTIPIELTNLVNLEHLNLSRNLITSIIPEIENLVSLKELYFHINLIKEIPAEIGNLNNLTHLGISFNPITSIPSEIGNLSNLISIDLSNNEIVDVPLSFANFNGRFEPYLHNNLLPSDAVSVLDGKGIKIESYNQKKLVISPTSETVFSIVDQNSLDESISTVKLEVDGSTASTEHNLMYEQLIDESGNSVTMDEYILNGKIIKDGSVRAKIRSLGTGVLLADNDNAITDEYVTLNFKRTLYSVNFDLNGGVGTIPPTQSLAEGELVLVPSESPTRFGFLINGWAKNADGTDIWDFTTDKMPASGLTLYASWRSNTAPTLAAPTFTEIKVGDPFDTNAGVGAIDTEDGDLTSLVDINSLVDTSVAGIYTVNYSVTDSDGNTSTAKHVVLVNDGTYVKNNDYIINAKDFSIELSKVNSDDKMYIKYANVKVYDIMAGKYLTNPEILVDKSAVQNKAGKYNVVFTFNPKITVTATVFENGSNVPANNSGTKLPTTGTSNALLAIILTILMLMIGTRYLAKSKL